MKNIFQLGDFVLSSGKKSKFKIEIDSFQDEDWETLAWLASSMIGPFSSVEGVPTGGLKLAEHLQKFVGITGPHLIVDDILTTGGSMNRTRDRYFTNLLKNKVTVGVVVIARGECPWWVKSILNMNKKFWF